MNTRAFAVAVCSTLVLLLPAGAGAQTTDETEKNISVVQQKPFVRGLRAEIVPAFIVVGSETLTSHIGVSATARFHITDEWAIGVDYIKYFGKLSQLASNIGDQYQVYPEKRLMDFYVGGHVTYVPFQGKFLLFNGPIVHWDAYLLAGMGATRNDLGKWLPTGNLGIGWRSVLVKWLTFNIEGHYFIYRETFNAGRKEFVNNFALTVGFGVFAPFGHDYKYPK